VESKIIVIKVHAVKGKTYLPQKGRHVRVRGKGKGKKMMWYQGNGGINPMVGKV